MYSDDSIICCLLPSSCNMFHRTPRVIFMDTMWYLNIMFTIFSFIFAVISISRIVHQLVEKFKDKLVEHKDTSEANRIKEPSLQKKVETDKYTYKGVHSDENIFDNVEESLGSDSDLLVPIQANQRQLKSYINDCFDSHTGSSEDVEITAINLEKNDKSARNSIISNKQGLNSSSSEEVEHCSHIMDDDFQYMAGTGKNLVAVPKEPFLQTVKGETNNGSNSKDK